MTLEQQTQIVDPDNIQDENKRTRTLAKNYDLFVTVVLTVLGAYQIYVGFFGARSAMDLRAMHWLIISSVLFLLYPASKLSIKRITPLDFIWVALAAASSSYILLNWHRIALDAGVVNTTDIAFGCIAVLVTLEAARRSIGAVLTCLASIFLLYAFWGHLIPGALGHREYSLTRIIQFLYTGSEGIFGIAMDVSAKYVAIFVLFGSMLEYFGGGELFVDLAYALTRKMRGGPAKAAVVSSALMGTMSGSAISNVVTTGTFTIPLMKRNGYKPYVAGAVEAVASTGGQIMPPVMGAAAFLMAEITGINYGSIMIAAVIPALFYFFAVFMMVDLEAAKEGIGAPAEEQIKPIGEIMKSRGYLMLPLILLVYMIFSGQSAIKSATYAIAMILLTDIIFSKDRKNMPKKFLTSLDKGMRSMINVASACACAGIIVGMISLTGIGTKFSTLMLSLSGGHMFIALVMTMVAAIILGCGLPTTAAYMILATLAAPALIKMGVSVLAAHLFVLYFGSLSTVTPPVALSAYAGAALAGANPNKVGFTAFRFSTVSFIVPYMFVYAPTLLMEGNALNIILSIISGLVGVVLIAVAVQGFWMTRCSVGERLISFIGGIALIIPGLATDAIGVVCAVIVLFIHRKKGPSV